MIALLVSPVTIPALRSTSDSVELVFFDVGQGTAVLARHGEYALLYDTGGGPPGGPAIATRSVLPGIFSLGIDALELLVISHPDRDHNAGETLIKQTFRPRRIRQGVGARPSQECRTGESQRMGNDILVHYLSQRLAGDSDNNASCTLVLSVFGRKILLAGDIDSRRERALLAYWGRELQVDVLLAGHHGSASSNSRLWLRSLDPHIMVVTAGRSNRFGHPAARVMETAEEQGINTANTATHGAMIVRIWPDGTMTCEAMRNRWQAFWRRGEFPRDCMAPRSLIRGYNQPHR